MKRTPNRLRVLRAERRVTQLITAQRARIQPSRLSLIENGHIDGTPEERRRLARFFKLPIGEVFPDAKPADTPQSDEAVA